MLKKKKKKPRQSSKSPVNWNCVSLQAKECLIQPQVNSLPPIETVATSPFKPLTLSFLLTEWKSHGSNTAGQLRMFLSAHAEMITHRRLDKNESLCEMCASSPNSISPSAKKS